MRALKRGGPLMSPGSAVVGRRFAFGAGLAFAFVLVACQGPDEYFRVDGGLSGPGNIGPGGASGVAGTSGSGTAGTGGSVSGLGGSISGNARTTGSAGTTGNAGTTGMAG